MGYEGEGFGLLSQDRQTLTKGLLFDGESISQAQIMLGFGALGKGARPSSDWGLFVAITAFSRGLFSTAGNY